MNTKGKL